MMDAVTASPGSSADGWRAPTHPDSSLDPDAPFHVAGHRGLVGSAIWRQLEAAGHRALLGRPSDDLDLRNRADVFDFYATERPVYVIIAAARVGGIGANSSRPADFISDNLLIQTNLLDAAHAFGVERLLFLGSSCIYPKHAPQPIHENALLTGPLEPTNAAYAVAKIAGIAQVQALRQQYGRRYVSAMPTNLYGPNDNFDLQNSHVLPAMIRKLDEGRTSGAPSVRLWGTGTPRREFLHVDDLAAACLHLLRVYDDSSPINVGTGTDLTIKELATLIADVVGFDGDIEWDASKPDGTPRKVLDTSRIAALGWSPTIPLRDGIAATYEWFRTTATESIRQA
jgi:GDP-L-fucose synthase